MFQQIPTVTKNLLIINFLVYFAQVVLERNGTDLASTFGLHFLLASDFRPWQLFTYMFLHGSFTHVLMNMFAFWMFGRIIEQTMGTKRFLLYYVVCGVGAGLCQEAWQFGEYYLGGYAAYDQVRISLTQVISMDAFLNEWNTVGASGAVYGVLLAFGVTFPNERILLLIPPIPMKAKYFVMGYAALELYSAFTSNGNIAHFAHLGGMLFGWLLIARWRRQARNGQTRFKGWDTWQPDGTNRSFAERVRNFFGRRPKMTTTRNPYRDRQADYDFNARRKADEERIDELLDKIKKGGYESLTEAEKKELFDKSRR